MDEQEQPKERRERLPDDRDGLTHHFTIFNRRDDGGVEEVDGYVRTGCYADGRLGELFITIGREGDEAAVYDQWAIAVSMALQHGADVGRLFRKFRTAQFKPYGRTKNEEISQCKSIIDYVSTWVLQKYAPTALLSPEEQAERAA